eukprot:gene21094-25067_t
MHDKQIFQTDTKKRWITFQWVTRIIIIVFLLAVGSVAYTLLSGGSPALPIINTNTALSKKQLDRIKKSTRYSDFKVQKETLLKIQKNQRLQRLKHPHNKARINAGFYVNWDPQSLVDLQENVKRLDMVLTESFFLVRGADTLRDMVDKQAIATINKNKKVGLAMISNYNKDHFDGEAVHQLLKNKDLQNRFIKNLIVKLKQYNFQGVNVDFEELKEKTNESLIAFQKNLYTQLHAQNLLVTMDISPDNEDYVPEILEKYNDYIFLMAYDQHSEMSNAGDISHQIWVEKQLDNICSKISGDKVILILACYGYDWPDQSVGKNVTYQQAIANANRYNAKIKFDPVSANLSYSYVDEGQLKHQVFFTDA